jgi:[acyl-carrier-protein] S-malonyltransferase
MKPAGARLENALEGVSIRDLEVPVVTNLEAEVNQSKDRVKELLVAQVSSPVRWEESMRRMIEKGIERVVEIGPGKVLSGLMKRIDTHVETGNLEDIKTLKNIS